MDLKTKAVRSLICEGKLSNEERQDRTVVRAGNCIIAFNDGRNVVGKLYSLGHNLVGDRNGIVTNQKIRGDLFGLDRRLGPLQVNGGFTPTHALLAGSPAIDTGIANGLKEDQRGYSRKRNLPEVHNSGDGSDIGALEYSAEPRGSRGAAGRTRNRGANKLRTLDNKGSLGV